MKPKQPRTIYLSPATNDLLETLYTTIRANGDKITYSEIIEEAILLLFDREKDFNDEEFEPMLLPTSERKRKQQEALNAEFEKISGLSEELLGPAIPRYEANKKRSVVDKIETTADIVETDEDIEGI